MTWSTGSSDDRAPDPAPHRLPGLAGGGGRRRRLEVPPRRARPSPPGVRLGLVPARARPRPDGLQRPQEARVPAAPQLAGVAAGARLARRVRGARLPDAPALAPAGRAV